MASEATHTFDYWLPLVTGAAGLISGVVIEWFRDNRTYRREKEARDASRRDNQIERRNDFQRQTLLALQDAVMALMRTVGQGHLLDLRAWHERREWHPEAYPNELNLANRDANGQTALLGVRVHDDSVRSLLQRLKSECNGLMGARDREASIDAYNEASALFVLLNERMGALLREMDEIELSH